MLERVEELSGGEVDLRLETFASARRLASQRRGDRGRRLRRLRGGGRDPAGRGGLPDARHPDGREAGTDVIFRLRFGLDLYAGIRPVRLYPGAPTPLRETATGSTT